MSTAALHSNMGKPHRYRLLTDAEACKRFEAGDYTEFVRLISLKLPPPSIGALRLATKHAIAALNKSGHMLDAALAYARFGLPVFPVDRKSKRPLPKREEDPTGKYPEGIPGTGGVYRATTNSNIIRRWWTEHPGALIALPMGKRTGVWTLDVDTSEDHADGLKAWSEIVAQHEPLRTREHRSATDGPHLIFRWDAELCLGCSKGSLPNGIEVKGQGGYVVVPPSVRKRRSYTVYRDIDPVEPPGWLVNQILLGRRPGGDATPPTLDAPLGDLTELGEAMECIPNDADWDEWAKVGLALSAASGHSDAGFQIFVAFSQRWECGEYSFHETEKKWEGIRRSPPERIGAGYLFKLARQHGWRRKLRVTQPNSDQQSPYVSPDVARAAVRKVVQGFLLGYVFHPSNQVVNYFRDYAYYGAGPYAGLGPCICAARSDVGGSKTTITVEETAKWMRVTGKQPVIYATPRHELNEEVVALFTQYGINARIFRGRTADDPNNPAQKMCLNLTAVELAGQCFADVFKSCCHDGKRKCAFFNRCSYIEQFPIDNGGGPDDPANSHPDVWVVATDLLFHAQKVLGKPVALIIDESFWRKGIRGIDSKKNKKASKQFEWVVPIASLLHPHADAPINVADPIAMRNHLRNKLGEVLQRQLHNGGVEYRNLDGWLGLLDCNDAIRLEWKCHADVASKLKLQPGMSATEMSNVEKSNLIDEIQHGRRIIRIWEAVRDLLSSIEDIEVSGRLKLKPKNGQRLIEWRGLEKINKQFRVPTLLLDATLPPLSILECYFPKADHVYDRVKITADIKIAMSPHTCIRQVFDAPISSTKLGQERHRIALRHYILQRWLEFNHPETLVITQQKFDQWLQGKLPDNITVKHFNDIAGLDRFKHVPLQILIGRTQPDAKVIEDLTGALTGRQPKSLSVNKRFVWGYLPVERKIYLKDGRAIIAKGDEHPDPAAEAPRYQVCEGELIQASGRGRGIHRTVEHPLQEDRVFDNSLGGVIDEASTWAVPSAAIEMLVEGMMLTSRVDMMKAWSDIWRSDSAARRTLEDLKQEPHCSLFARLLRGWRPVTYQLAGAKMKPRVAYFDPTCVADPRLWLEQRFGPLELFMDGGPHWAALLDGFST